MAIIKKEDGTPMAESVEDLQDLVAQTPDTPAGLDLAIADIGMTVEQFLHRDFPESKYDGQMSVNIEATEMRDVKMGDRTLDGVGVEVHIRQENEILKTYRFFVEMDEHKTVLGWMEVNVIVGGDVTKN